MRALTVSVGLALQLALPITAVADPWGVFIVFRLLGAYEEYVESGPEREAAEAAARADAARAAGIPPPIACARPAMPKQAQAAGLRGTVHLRFLVDVNGAVIDAQVHKSSGIPALDEAGLAAIRLCTLPPMIVDGQAVQSWQSVGYSWNLD